MADVNKIDSNVTGLYIAEEATLKTLPTTPVWHGQEPNSYEDFGADLSQTAREPINPSRQRQKGVITDLDAKGGFNADITLNNMPFLMQGFFFASIREDATTKPMDGTQVVITGVENSTSDFTAASGLGIFATGDLVLTKGFSKATNNGLHVVSSAASGSLVVAETLVDETPTSAAYLQRVGHKFAAGDVTLTYSGGVLSITATAGSFDDYGFIPGTWVFLGGDAAGSAYTNNVGYARISEISTNGKTLTFDVSTFTPVTEAGATVSLQMFWGSVIRNEKDPALIVRRTYQLERQLGNDGNGTQSEYLIGAVPDGVTINLSQADKINVDLSYVGCDVEYRNGTTGVKSGTRVNGLGETAINTTSDIHTVRLNVIDPTNPATSGLFAYISEGTIEIANNIDPNKAIGTLGAFDTSAGNFEVSGSLTAYFANVAAAQAVRANADVGLYCIFAASHGGIIYDLPLLSLGGGMAAVEKDSPITVDLEMDGAESKFGHTLLNEFFPYLPTVAMP